MVIGNRRLICMLIIVLFIGTTLAPSICGINKNSVGAPKDEFNYTELDCYSSCPTIKIKNCFYRNEDSKDTTESVVTGLLNYDVKKQINLGNNDSVDQYNHYPTPFNKPVYNYIEGHTYHTISYAQEFQPTLRTLTRIKLHFYIEKYHQYIAQIKISIKDSLNGKNLINSDIEPEIMEGYYAIFDFEDIPIDVSKKYYIIVEAVGEWNYSKNHGYWYYNYNDIYPEGKSWTKVNGVWSSDEILDFGFVTYGDQPPYITAITGPLTGKVNNLYYYNISVEENEREDVYLYVNWGDKTIDEWIGPYKQGEIIRIDHAWDRIKQFKIEVKAKDTDGLESDWATLEVSMPKVHRFDPITHFMQKVL